MLASAEQCISKMEEESAIDNSWSITCNALLEKWYCSVIVLVTSLHNEAQVYECKPILWILPQHLPD